MGLRKISLSEMAGRVRADGALQQRLLHEVMKADPICKLNAVERKMAEDNILEAWGRTLSQLEGEALADLMHAQFDANVMEYPGVGGVIVVFDRGGGRSVTNDAEYVVEQLAQEFELEGRQVVYRDSMGTWDSMLVHGQKFAGFHVLHATSLNEALEKLKSGH